MDLKNAGTWILDENSLNWCTGDLDGQYGYTFSA